jgi:hypothetical protein
MCNLGIVAEEKVELGAAVEAAESVVTGAIEIVKERRTSSHPRGPLSISRLKRPRFAQ